MYFSQGLRGIASLLVVSSHVTLCFARSMLNACCDNDSTRTPKFWQLPYFRLLASGHSWVALFLVLLGFVNALGPLKQARKGDVETALGSLSKSIFRRAFRLVLPATTATIMSWLACQFGAYEIGRQSDAWWLYNYVPAPSATWAKAMEDLMAALQNTWSIDALNAYDQPQWALIFLFQGSIVLFAVLLGTISLTPSWRAALVTVCIFWSRTFSRSLRDPMVGLTVLGGALLAEFSYTNTLLRIAEWPFVSSVIAPFLALVGLWLMSVPTRDLDVLPWTQALSNLANTIWPDAFAPHLLISSIGALLLCFSILISPQLRGWLSAKQLRWLGKFSFPIYLLHGPFLASVMAWVVFLGRPFVETKNDVPAGMDVVARYTQPGNARIWFGIFISNALMLLASHAWTNKMEPAFGNITAWAENKMKGKQETQGILNGKMMEK